MNAKMFLVLTIFLTSTTYAFSKNLPVVDSVDLTRYQGKWYEIAAIPQSFQKQCVGNTTAEYTIVENNEVQVMNSCGTQSGERSLSEGRARVVDSTTNAKLEVTFVKVAGKWLWLASGDYWIIKLEDNYQYVVVGHPSRDYGWILSRNPNMSSETLAELKVFLKDRGYDVCQFMLTPQDGGNSERKSLCDKKKKAKAPQGAFLI